MCLGQATRCLTTSLIGAEFSVKSDRLQGHEPSKRPNSISRLDYHGWPDALLLSNGTVEVIIVPAIGRVMQFRFAGEETGAFWENANLHGRLFSSHPAADGWLNLGGDKTWPAPQSDWEMHTGRAWPPPVAFDSAPYRAMVADGQVLLISEVEPNYCMRAVRCVSLAPQAPQLRITTEYQKVAGATVNVGVWAITQFPEPERVFVLLPERPSLPEGYVQQRGPAPKDLRRDGRLLSLIRDSAEYIKIGTEGTSMLWMDERLVLCIQSETQTGQNQDAHIRTEVYTNPDPLHYVELETVGPLAALAAGGALAESNTYTLFHRSTPDCLLEARHLFNLA